MKKYYTNKIITYISILIFSLFFNFGILYIATFFLFKKFIENVILIPLLIILFLLISIIETHFISKIYLNKKGNYITINDYFITYYKHNKVHFEIAKTDVENIYYCNHKNSFDKLVTFKIKDQKNKILFLGKKTLTKIAKELNKGIYFCGRSLKKKLKDFFIEMKSEIKANKFQILCCVLGVIITIVSFILYINFKEKLWLIILLVIINIIFGIFQIVYVIFKNKDYHLWEKIFFQY